MKKSVITIAVIALLGMGGMILIGSTVGFSSARTVAAEFSVDRLTCGSCVETISEAVSQIDGVSSVATDVDQGQTIVRYDPTRTGIKVIADAITGSGYPAQLYARENADGVMTNEVDTDLYIARIGERLVTRSEFNTLIEQQRLAAIDSGQALPVQYMVRFAWMSILQRELLLTAAAEAGITVANAEVDVYLESNQLSPADREKARTNLLLERFFLQRNIDVQKNSAELASLLRLLQQNVAVQIFDLSLKQNLYGDKNKEGGCGGNDVAGSGGKSCCG